MLYRLQVSRLMGVKMQDNNVICLEHHDGWALFDFPESVSKRSTVHYGPKRDFLKELLDVAKAKHPKIRRGKYYIEALVGNICLLIGSRHVLQHAGMV